MRKLKTNKIKRNVYSVNKDVSKIENRLETSIYYLTKALDKYKRHLLSIDIMQSSVEKTIESHENDMHDLSLYSRGKTEGMGNNKLERMKRMRKYYLKVLNINA